MITYKATTGEGFYLNPVTLKSAGDYWWVRITRSDGVVVFNRRYTRPHHRDRAINEYPGRYQAFYDKHGYCYSQKLRKGMAPESIQ